MNGSAALVWFRRDLRLDDQAALAAALGGHERVWCAFVFDREILDALHGRSVRRVAFLLECLRQLDAALRQAGGGLIWREGRPEDEIPRLAAELNVAAVYANRDYEPTARRRDAAVARRLAADGRAMRGSKDQVIFERDEVLSGAGRPYAVFTPYRRAWLARLTPQDLAPHPVQPWLARLAPPPLPAPLPDLARLGFTAEPAPLPPAGMAGGEALFQEFAARIDDYAERRDIPALAATSGLSAHLRFGTVSIRRLAAFAHGRATLMASRGAEVWLSELIWREFYQMLLWHHPYLVDGCFKPAFDALAWADDPAPFLAWCEGRTGYPLVDAAMAQLNRTGFMHNRLRMVAASFLTKDLGQDWRRGAGYFAEQLIDHDLAANNGGWQWAASTGCDAQPWFRIFNPVAQSERFDPGGVFIRSQLPVLAAVPDRFIHAPWQMSHQQQTACGVLIGRDYPAPLVDHALARQRTLERFRQISPRLR
ncbi:deoxyribodipyrimidine photolyase [Denitratisoma sp. DHT3]|uniref:cryptochrome/photolyase family protein n=1 Tax=Denitratisoma sp. DHT3 TaxID=1981880 RepID=UPI001198381A|nr:deoxyribodipyrimidine photo-lyase [Denitratisoma sp. DHT3]QDX81788.1 deoxyribodipyrimidine photolyase [Denitratisoma sp. DHT3]